MYFVCKNIREMKCFIIGSIFVTLQFSLASSTLTCEENYCYGREAPSDYPLKTITSLVQELDLQYRGENQMRHGYPPNLAEGACETTEIGDPIYQIIDENNNKRHVVQVQDRFLQELRVVKCKQPGELCEEKPPLFYEEMLEYFKVSCIDKKVKVRFLVLSDDEKRLEVATVKEGIPLGCFCRYDENPKPAE